MLTKVKAKNPDVIMFGGMDAQAGPMLADESPGIKAKFISGDGAQSAELIKLGGDAAEGSYATTAGLPKEKMPQGAAFYDKFKAKFNADVQVYAPFTYDATNVLIAAIQKAGTDPAKIIDAIKATSMDGVTGKIAFDDKGDIKDGAVTVFMVKGGSGKPLKSSVARKKLLRPLLPGSPAPAAARPRPLLLRPRKKRRSNSFAS